MFSALPASTLSDSFVLFGTKLPGGVQGAVKYVFTGRSQADVGGAGAAPAPGDGKEEVWALFGEGGLLLGREHEVAEAFALGSEGGEDVAADAEVGGTHVGAFFSAGEAEGDAAEIVWCHT